MSKIINIGCLDVSDIKEEIAKEITDIENIGLLIESDRSQLLLRDCKKKNIGSSLKLPSDTDVSVIPVNGEIKIDQDYLEGFIKPIVLLVNGLITFKDNVDKQLLNDKIYLILVNGVLIAPKNLSGIIQSKCQINGKTNIYNSGYIYFDNKLSITNRFLRSIKPLSKIAVNNLLLIEEVDTELFRKKLSNIQILENIVALEKYDELLSEVVDEYYEAELQLIPEGKENIRYIEGDLQIDDNSIKSYNKNTLYVEGEVSINLSSDPDIRGHIGYIICSKLMCNDKTYNIIKEIIDKNVEIEIVEGKLIKNTGKLYISESFKEPITINNIGKIIFEESVDAENLDKYLISLSNFGSIEAPKHIISILQSKAIKNFGKIKTSEHTEDIKKEDESDIMYSNSANLKL